MIFASVLLPSPCVDCKLTAMVANRPREFSFLWASIALGHMAEYNRRPMNSHPCYGASPSPRFGSAIATRKLESSDGSSSRRSQASST